MSKIPDVTDPDIRAMVLRNHEPHEEWWNSHDGAFCKVFCDTCLEPWPCPSIKAAREAQRKRNVAALKGRASR